MGFIADIFGGGDDAADAATQAAGIQAQSQREALDYLKQIEAIPQQYRQQALGQLWGQYNTLSQQPQPAGLGLGDPGYREDLVGRAQSSPLYSAMMSGLNAGEQSIMRNAGATGGLRSGNTNSALAEFGTELQNKALLAGYGQEYAMDNELYNRGLNLDSQRMGILNGMAGLQSYAPQIASGMAGIGQTMGQGITAAGQAQQASRQQGWGNMLGLASFFL